ncbi:WXG100 family type VII secretion target [Kutzneria chonburiensis]|uniref:WXG100 family type VII secretion target n=1 Tax=Kutzneria chonburiensis TaxID=1483604 RepID=A0ABV6N0W1_9PSEU|nr:hypothetical protein [Kutzneria chonburiensis]
MADPSETNNNPGEGTPDDFSTWDWHKIMTAIVGYYGSASNSGLSNPQSLKDAANALNYVKGALEMVGQSIRDQADALSYGDDAPWKGEAASAFNTKMYQLSQNIKANAQVLGGDIAADNIPNQVFQNGVRLDTAIQTIHAIDQWYADQALARGASKDKNGYVMVHEDQVIVDMMTNDMRKVITNLSGHYAVTNDGFTAPSPDDLPGPNDGSNFNIPPPPGGGDGGGNNNPFGDGNNNPFGDGGGGGGGGGSDFKPPPVNAFNGGGDGGGSGGGGTGGGSDFKPPPISPFPGGGDGLGGDGLGGGGGGGGGLGGNNLAAIPPPSQFPGGGDGLGGDGLGGGAGGGSGGGGSNFVPPPVSQFPGGLGGSGGGLGNTGLGNSGLGNSGLDGLGKNNDLFNDTSGQDGSGLGNTKFSPPPVSGFPGDTGLGGSGGGGAGGLGDDKLGGAGGGGLDDLKNLANNLEQNAPNQFPGLGDGTGGGLGGANNNQLGAGGMPPMGGMGGGMGGMGQNNPPPKSDASGLLNPTKFPGSLDGDVFDPSTLLHGGDGASGGGGGLSGLDGLKGLEGLDNLTSAGGGGGGGSADLPPVSGFPGSTDVNDPSLTGDHGLGQDGFGDGLGGNEQQLAQAGGGPAGVPGSGMPMSPGMGGMGGGMGNQNQAPPKSDASGLLNPTAFPGGGMADYAGDPSVLLSGGTGAAGGSGSLDGLDNLAGSDGGADLPPVGGFPGSTDVNDPSLAGAGGVHDLGQDGAGDNQQLPAGGGPAGTPGAPGAGMPMSPGMGGMGGGMGNQNQAPPKSDASGLLDPTAFPGGGMADYAGDPSVLLSGGTGAAGGSGTLYGLDGTTPADVTETAAEPTPGMPTMMTPGVAPGQPSSTPAGHRSDASELLATGSGVGESAFAEGHGGHHPGNTEHIGVPSAEPATPPDRVAMVHGNDGAEDFTAWEVGGASSAAVLPWLFGRKGQDGQEDLATDAPVEDNDKWVQGDLRGVPAPADDQAKLATWRPGKIIPGSAEPEPEVSGARSSFHVPDPNAEPEPEPEPDSAVAEGEEPEEEPERTSADLLDRRSDQWDSRGSDVPGVLG